MRCVVQRSDEPTVWKGKKCINRRTVAKGEEESEEVEPWSDFSVSLFFF